MFINLASYFVLPSKLNFLAINIDTSSLVLCKLSITAFKPLRGLYTSSNINRIVSKLNIVTLQKRRLTKFHQTDCLLNKITISSQQILYEEILKQLQTCKH